MEVQDFYNLKIGQIIWYKGFSKKIITLFASDNCSIGHIQFDGDKTYTWNDIRKQCSLEKPKEKIIKRYWQWKIKTSDIYGWERFDKYLDDNGHCSVHRSGDPEIFDWENIAKIKIEDDFVDEEVEQ